MCVYISYSYTIMFLFMPSNAPCITDRLQIHRLQLSTTSPESFHSSFLPSPTSLSPTLHDHHCTALVSSFHPMPFFSGSGNDNDEYDNLGIDWVIHYVFDDVGLHLLPLLPRITSEA